MAFYYLCIHYGFSGNRMQGNYELKTAIKVMKKGLFVAFAALVSLIGCKNTAQQTTAEGEAAAREVGSGDIVYVQVEAVLAQCDLYKNEIAPFQEKAKKVQESLAKKEQGFQYEAAQLQERYQKGLITTADAQAKQENIQKRIAAYQNSAQKEAQTLGEEEMVLNNRASDLVMRAVKQLNADKRYKLIVNASALIDADTLLDITPVVLETVNKLYAEDKEADKK